RYLQTYNDIIKDHDVQIKVTQTYVKTFLKDIINDIKIYDKEKMPKYIDLDNIVKNIVDSLPKVIECDKLYSYIAEYLIAKSSYHYFYDSMAAKISMKRI